MDFVRTVKGKPLVAPSPTAFAGASLTRKGSEEGVPAAAAGTPVDSAIDDGHAAVGSATLACNTGSGASEQQQQAPDAPSSTNVSAIAAGGGGGETNSSAVLSDEVEPPAIPAVAMTSVDEPASTDTASAPTTVHSTANIAAPAQAAVSEMDTEVILV